MVEIKDLRIRKGIYKFEARRKFQHVNRFKVIERKPVDRIKDAIKSMLAPKKEKKKAVISKKPAEPEPGGFNFALVGAAFAIALLIIFVGFVMWQMNAAVPTPAPFKPLEKSMISNTFVSSEVLTAGMRGTTDHVAALKIDYDSKSLVNYTINFKTYRDELPTEYFILNYEPKVEAGEYAEFLSGLRSEFGSKGVGLNEITTDQLETVPKGALVIVPTGVVPEELLSGPGNVSSLVDRGVVVMYIGQSFKSMIRGPNIIPTPQPLSDAQPVAFNELAAPTCTSEVPVFQPLYTTVGTRGLSSFSIYGCISVVKKGSGALIFVPQTIIGGKLEPEHIATIALEHKWAVPDDSSGSTYMILPPSADSEISGEAIFFTNPYKGENRTVKVEFVGTSTTGAVLEDMQITKAAKKQRGELYVTQTTVTSTNITGDEVRMNARLAELTPASPLMYVVFTDNLGKEVYRELEGNRNTQSEQNLDVSINVDEGEYLVNLEDDSSNVYASAYLEVTSVRITGPRGGANPAIYVFDVSTPITLSTVDVSVDRGAYTNRYTNVPPGGTIVVDVTPYSGGDALSYGNHTFDFTVGTLSKSISYNRPLPPSPFPPEMFLAVLLAGVIVGVGVYFARREQVFYSLDVPDFPPISRTKIPLTTNTVLSIFDKVNENYRWEYTPLTVSEVKNGFKDIYHHGNPIYITDYNSEYLLNELVRKKKVDSFMEYFGLPLWEGKSKHSFRYLAMMRRLRDLCVNNAVPFTQLGESKSSDSEITVVGQEMYLHFFEDARKAEIVKRSLDTLAKGITIILFRDNSEKQGFSKIMNSSSPATSVLKVEIENSSVLLLTYPELESMVQEFKGV